MRVKNPELYHTFEVFINDYINRFGISPTIRTIASCTGTSTATVSRYLQEMRSKGLIEYSGHKGFITRQMQKTRNETELIPLYGDIACGIPNLAEGSVDDYIRLPVSLIGKGNFFLLRAKGNSMIDAGIATGDLVLIRQQHTADTGQIIVALIGDEATLKRYYPEPQHHRIRLHPENKNMSDIYVTNCIIQGIAVNVIKNLT